MSAEWADEKDHSEPLPALEPFYTLAALELGDPDGKNWIMRKAPEFHALYKTYRKAKKDSSWPTDSAAVLVQYLIWYERSRPKAQS